MSDVPSFFFSHARQDRETPGNYLRTFFDDLEIKLAQWAGVSLQDVRLGTIDARVPQSDDWDEDLSRGLAEANAFVAILTPVYLNRPNCGKELSIFVLRSPGMGIDQNGALTGVDNVMLIRWLPEGAYSANTGKDSLIPPILRRIQDTPADEGRDAERTKAIERYRKKGMEKCVHAEPHYGELLDLFVARIRGMSKLPPAAREVSFATALDAFRYDWAHHFTAAGREVVAASAPIPAAAPIAPRALTSVVAFYVTRRSFTRDPSAVDFADQLLAETLSPSDPAFAALLSDIRMAGIEEGFSVFHAAADPIVPARPEPLLGRLAALSASRVLTILVVDPAVWPGKSSDAGGAVVEQIVRSKRWMGPVLLPCLDKGGVNVDELVERGLPPRLVALPQEREARIGVLRRAFVDTRGRVLRTSTEQVPDAERLPVLKNVGAEGS